MMIIMKLFIDIFIPNWDHPKICFNVFVHLKSPGQPGVHDLLARY